MSQCAGVGRRMPGTTIAFTIAALAMIGVPPARQVREQVISRLGWLGQGDLWVIALLMGSSLLNAAYFLPILHRAWFGEATAPDAPARPRIGWMLTAPPLATAALVLAAGLMANAPFSPLGWTRFIVAIECVN